MLNLSLLVAVALFLSLEHFTNEYKQVIYKSVPHYLPL